MAAVKASEARGNLPLLRAVEVARLVSGEGAGLPSAELAGILAPGPSPLLRAPRTGASARPITGRLPPDLPSPTSSPPSALLAPVMGSLCKAMTCGKGNCTVATGLPGYRCDCDPGWTQMHVGDSLRFLPCVIPNYEC